MDDGRWRSTFSKSKVINLASEGLRAPKADSKAFCWEGKVRRTSKDYMAAGDWAKSSTIL